MVENTFEKLYKSGVEALKKAEIENAEYDCKVLFEKAFGEKYMAVEKQKTPEKSKENVFLKMMERRINGEPLQYIIGEWEFMGLDFKVGDGVLIPRQDTETLVEFLVSKFKNKKDLKILDLCAGSGCIAIALEKLMDVSEVTAVELSSKASGYLEKNIKLNNSRVKLLQADALSEETVNSLGEYDIIVSNPPYLTAEDMKTLQKEVSFEPEMALFGGDDGLDFYRAIVRLYKPKLSEGGMLAFEIGIGQEDEVSYMMIHSGLKNVRFKADLCGVNRIVFGENIVLEND